MPEPLAARRTGDPQNSTLYIRGPMNQRALTEYQLNLPWMDTVRFTHLGSDIKEIDPSMQSEYKEMQWIVTGETSKAKIRLILQLVESRVPEGCLALTKEPGCFWWDQVEIMGREFPPLQMHDSEDPPTA